LDDLVYRRPGYRGEYKSSRNQAAYRRGYDLAASGKPLPEGDLLSAFVAGWEGWHTDQKKAKTTEATE
jgi:hypothetical protein